MHHALTVHVCDALDNLLENVLNLFQLKSNPTGHQSEKIVFEVIEHQNDIATIILVFLVHDVPKGYNRVVTQTVQVCDFAIVIYAKLIRKPLPQRSSIKSA